MHDSLLEFLRTGILSSIHLGMTTNDVLAKLGQPNDVSYQNNAKPSKPSIWRFGSPRLNNLQLFIQDGQIKGVGLYLWGCRDIQSLPSALLAKNWQITGHTTFEEFTHLLNTKDIKWTIDESFTFEGQVCVLAQSNAHAFWTHGEHDGLQKIVLSDNRGS